MIMRHPPLRLAAMVLFVLLLAGCGGQSTPPQTPNSTDLAPSPTAGPTATPTPLPYAGLRPQGALERLGKGSIDELIISPDGKNLAVSASSGLYVERADTLDEVWRAAADPAPESISYSPDSTLIAGAAHDDKQESIVLWDAATGVVVHTLDGRAWPVKWQDSDASGQPMAWSPDGSSIAAAGDENTIVIWNPKTGEQSATLTGHSGPVSGIAWSPDSQGLASIGGDGSLLLWDLETGGVSHTLENVGSRILAWSPDGKLLAAGTGKGEVVLWNAATGGQLLTMSGHQMMTGFLGDITLPILALKWSPDSKTLASVSTDAILWDAQTGTKLYAFTPQAPVTGGLLTDVSFSPDGATLAAWPELTLYNTQSGANLYELGGDEAAWSPDSAHMASWSKSAITVWDASTGSVVKAQPGFSGEGLRSVAWSPDGALLAAGSGNSNSDLRALSGIPSTSAVMLDLWDPKTQQPLDSLDGHTGSVNALGFSFDGTLLATASQDGTIIVRDTATRKSLYVLPSGSSDPKVKRGINGLAWSPDNLVFATGGSTENKVTLWDGPTGDRLADLNVNAWVMSLAWSPDGKTIAAGMTNGKIDLWDVAAKSQISTLAGHPGQIVDSLAWSPDSKTLASGGRGGSIIVWDAATGEPVTTIEDEDSPGLAVWMAWSPDGTMLASSPASHSVFIWDPKTGKLLNTLKADAKGLAWSPDGTTLAVVTADGSIVFWPASPLP